MKFFDLDIILILISCLLLFYGPASAGVFAIGQGLFVDLFSGGLQGLFATLYLSAFGGIYLGSRFFDLLEPKSQMFLVCFAFLMKKALFFILLNIFSLEAIPSATFLWMSGISLIGTGLCAPAIFYLFDRLRVTILAGTGDGMPEELVVFFNFPAESDKERGHD